MISFAAGSRLRVIPAATICASHRIGAPAWSAARACLHDTGGMLHVSGEIDHAGGVDHAYYDARGFVVETGKVGFGADGGEAAPIDFRTVANIVAHQIPSTT